MAVEQFHKKSENNDPHVLIVAGSDSSGGAGIARDIETVSASGLKSCLAITAVTAQTHGKVVTIKAVEAELVGSQMLSALATNRVCAIKIGMLANADILNRVAEVLKNYPDIPVVLDPVLVSSSGAPLLDQKGMMVLLDELLPLCTLVTPNLPELSNLSGVRLEGPQDIIVASTALVERGARAILAKGGHGEGKTATDRLYRPGLPQLEFSSKRFAGNLRGTGCMLSSAIASGQANGLSLELSIEAAKVYLSSMFEKNTVGLTMKVGATMPR